jgi:hypothetical protein
MHGLVRSDRLKSDYLITEPQNGESNRDGALSANPQQRLSLNPKTQVFFSTRPFYETT